MVESRLIHPQFAWHNKTIFLGYTDDTNIVITNTEIVIEGGRVITKFEGATVQFLM